MILELCPFREVARRIDARKGEKVRIEMGLIEVAAIQHNVRPANGVRSRDGACDTAQHAFGALTAAEWLW